MKQLQKPLKDKIFYKPVTVNSDFESLQ